MTSTSLGWLRYGARETLQPVLRRLSHATGVALAKPAWVSIGLTHRCNCRCIHCDIWKLPPSEELGGAAWRRVIEDLGGWLRAGRLHFSGGEPLLRRELPELIRTASLNGFLVGVVTNGLLLTRPKAEELLAAGLFTLDVSLDSLDPGAHDRIRGVEGAHARAVEAIETMVSLGAGNRTSIACVLSSANIDGVEALVGWVRTMGLRGISIQVLEENFEGPHRRGWQSTHPLWVRDPHAVEHLSERLLSLRAAGAPILNHPRQLELLPEYYRQPERIEGLPCLVGYLNLGIGPRGDVRLCHRLPPLGNVLENSPREVWRSHTAKVRRKQVAACERGCKILNCNYPPGPLTRLRRLAAMRGVPRAS